MKYAQAQPLVYSRLEASAAFAGVPLMLQIGDDATPAQIENAEAVFEDHLKTKGIVIVVMRPYVSHVLSQGTSGGVKLMVTVPIAITENPAVNRVAPGLQKSCDDFIDDVVAAVICGDYVGFPPRGQVGRVDLGDGLLVNYIEPLVACVTRARAAF